MKEGRIHTHTQEGYSRKRVRVRVRDVRVRVSGSRRLPPVRFPCDQGRDRRGGRAGPARGGWPLPACGEPTNAR